MAYGLYFQPSGFTPDEYHKAIRQLDQAGAGFGSVPGRTFHCAMEVGGLIQEFDVWESMEQFQKFGETLMSHPEQAGRRSRRATDISHPQGRERLERDTDLPVASSTVPPAGYFRTEFAVARPSRDCARWLRPVPGRWSA
jgi:hypothetical protein